MQEPCSAFWKFTRQNFQLTSEEVYMFHDLVVMYGHITKDTQVETFVSTTVDLLFFDFVDKTFPEVFSFDSALLYQQKAYYYGRYIELVKTNNHKRWMIYWIT